MSDITVPVLIVGGGGAGLTASMLLSSYGVDSLLVSKYPGTSHLPKAHVLHQKTMEVYREVGIADLIYERGTPPGKSRQCCKGRLPTHCWIPMSKSASRWERAQYSAHWKTG